jgi:hypothetical protein
MTEQEFFSLSNSQLYTFKLYNGIIKHGYITRDIRNIQKNIYYIVHPNSSNRDKPAHEIGYPVSLSQIETHEVLSKSPKYYGGGSSTMNGNIQSKKLIILGAGASYDSTYDHNLTWDQRMPMTNYLFEDRFLDVLKKYNGAYDLSSEILLGKTSLEDYFQKQWHKIERTHDQALLNKIINTQYYLHDLFSTLSEKFSNSRKCNYLNLVKLAHEYTTHNPGEYIPIVTFNYDTLLEDALQRHLQYNYHHMDSYIDSSQYKLLVFKPHGSCNWVRKFKPGFAPTTFIDQHVNSIDLMAKHIYVNNKSLNQIQNHLEQDVTLYIKNPNPNAKIKQNSIYNNHYPWMLIPYKDKDALIMPDNHEMTLTHTLTKVEEILIIGWKGAETTFQKILQNSLGGRALKITLVEPDEKAAENFKSTYKNILPNATYTTMLEDKNICSTFTKFIESCHTYEKHFFN